MSFVESMRKLVFILTTLYHRTLLEGDRKAGLTVFWADDGLDTGPILLQKETDIDINDTVDSLYSRFLYPEGIRAMVCVVLHDVIWCTGLRLRHFLT